MSAYPIASEVTRRMGERFPDIHDLGCIHPISDRAASKVDYLGWEEDSCCGSVMLFTKDVRHTYSHIWARKGKSLSNGPRPLLQDLDWLPYPDVRDENKYYIEGGKYTIEEPWKRTAEYRIIFHADVHTIARIAMFHYVMFIMRRKKFYRADL